MGRGPGSQRAARRTECEKLNDEHADWRHPAEDGRGYHDQENQKEEPDALPAVRGGRGERFSGRMSDMSKKVFRLALQVAPLLCSGILAGATPDDFYLQRLRAGTEFYSRGNTVVAADEFRIACFGFLEHPVLLEEGLARLALAQFKTGRLPETDDALTRFAEVELRFGTFKDVALEPAVRAEFVELARKRMLPEKFRSLTVLSGAAAAPAAPAKMVESPRVQATPEPAPVPVVTVAAPVAPPVAPPAVVLPPPAPAPPSATPQDIEAIRQLIAERKTPQAWVRAKEALAKGIPTRELQKAALAAAVLSSDFTGGKPLAEYLEPFKGGEEVDAFYAGVAFWETGNRGKGKALIQMAGPRVADSPWVKYYLGRAQAN